ncbi:MAG: CBS domain-containing protein [Saccharofermentanales bacterium]
MKIKDIMSTTIAIINPENTVIQAAQLMKNHDVGSIPVCLGEQVVGIITDRDIALKVVANGSNPATLRVGEIMSPDPILGNPEMDVAEAGELMGKNQIRRLPIVDNDRLVGIVSLGDIAIEPMLQEKAGGILTEVSESSSAKTDADPAVKTIQY